MNYTIPFNSNDFFFTKDENPILFNTPLNDTYFEMKVSITAYQFYTDQPTTRVLEYKIPLFQKKSSFDLGMVVDRSMPKMKGINLRSLFQYKTTVVKLDIKEISTVDHSVISETTHNGIKFIAGYKPQNVNNNNCFLDLYNLPARVTENGVGFINVLLTTGTHNFTITKNGVDVANFDINVLSTNICSRALIMDDYSAKKGDVIECKLTAAPDIKKVFYIFPKTAYSNYIAFEDEYLLKNIIQFTGEYKIITDFATKFNRLQNGLVETQQKVSSKKESSFILNTGFVLQEQELQIESLIDSKKAWLIIGENEGIELIPNTKKIAKTDPTTELYSYDIEFLINPKNYKPLLVELNKPLEIVEMDDIPPTAPLNLRSINTTTNKTTLLWNPSTDANGVVSYDIYMNDAFLETTNSLSYTVPNLEAETAYNFYIKAKDSSGNVSESSNVLEVTTAAEPDTEPPTAPGNLQAIEITSSTLKLDWTASTDNVGVVKYSVYKNDIKIGETTFLLQFLVTGLLPNSTNSFYVTAEDASGNVSVPSATINPTTLEEYVPPSNPYCPVLLPNPSYMQGYLPPELGVYPYEPYQGCTCYIYRPMFGGPVIYTFGDAEMQQ